MKTRPTLRHSAITAALLAAASAGAYAQTALEEATSYFGTGEVVPHAMEVAQRGNATQMTRAEVRDEFLAAQRSGTLVPQGDVGDTAGVLVARAEFNVAQTQQILAARAEAERLMAAEAERARLALADAERNAASQAQSSAVATAPANDGVITESAETARGDVTVPAPVLQASPSQLADNPSDNNSPQPRDAATPDMAAAKEPETAPQGQAAPGPDEQPQPDTPSDSQTLPATAPSSDSEQQPVANTEAIDRD